jgi:hypothetical protein
MRHIRRRFLHIRVLSQSVGLLKGNNNHIFVTYSAEYGTIKTGFQASGPNTIFTATFEQLTRHH